jgi:hypothetical protein
MDEARARPDHRKALHPPSSGFIGLRNAFLFAVHVTEMAKLAPVEQFEQSANLGG